jgi:ribonuclease HII
MDNCVKYIVGIDEVGRGPIAGPVAVCAFLIKDQEFIELATGWIGGELPKLRDSKKLSKKQREQWFDFLKKQKKEGGCDFSVSYVSSLNIDKFGIAKCIQKALDESLRKVASQNLSNFSRFTPEGSYTDKNLKDSASLASFHVYLDGGLHAPVEYVNQETIIRGDELHPVISMASIVAKVSRDKIMENFAKKYPEYGFEKHAGYGTKAHYEAIKKHGQTPIHRKSFIH